PRRAVRADAKLAADRIAVAVVDARHDVVAIDADVRARPRDHQPAAGKAGDRREEVHLAARGALTDDGFAADRSAAAVEALRNDVFEAVVQDTAGQHETAVGHCGKAGDGVVRAPTLRNRYGELGPDRVAGRIVNLAGDLSLREGIG